MSTNIWTDAPTEIVTAADLKPSDVAYLGGTGGPAPMRIRVVDTLPGNRVSIFGVSSAEAQQVYAPIHLGLFDAAASVTRVVL